MTQLTSLDPRTGATVGSVDVASPEDVRAAVERSRKAFPGWRTLGHGERKRHLQAYKRTILSNLDRVASTISAETGKERGEAVVEVIAGLAVADYYLRHAARLLRPERGRVWPMLTTRGWVEYEPLGVAAVISPWNYPFYLTLGPTFTALAAGCTVVTKPSEVTPLSGGLVAELADEAGLPPDVVQVVHGGPETGGALVESDVGVIAFTGSTPVGKLVASAAARTLTPVILELGGNDAMIVLEDADLKQAARAAVWARMFNAGQTCVAVERVYVVDDVYDEFLDLVVANLDRLEAGTGSKGDIGPIIHPPQLKVVEDHVADAVRKGATLVRGGSTTASDSGIFYHPTLLTEVDHSMEVMRHESFGPVLAVMQVPDEERALELASDSYHGLHGSVWTRNKRRARRIASRLETGSVAINDHIVNFLYPSIPLAGARESGLGGGQLGPAGIRAYCHPKGVTSARFSRFPTTWLLGARLPRVAGPRYWKALARALFGR